MNWNEATQTEEYKNLPELDKKDLQQRYYKKNIVDTDDYRTLNKTDQQDLHSRFFKTSYKDNLKQDFKKQIFKESPVKKVTDYLESYKSKEDVIKKGYKEIDKLNKPYKEEITEDEIGKYLKENKVKLLDVKPKFEKILFSKKKKIKQDLLTKKPIYEITVKKETPQIIKEKAKEISTPLNFLFGSILQGNLRQLIKKSVKPSIVKEVLPKTSLAQKMTQISRQEQTAIKKVGDQIAFKVTKKGIKPKIIDRIDDTIFDKFAPVKRFVKTGIKEGISLEDANNPYVLSRLMAGFGGKPKTFLEHKTFNYAGVTTGKGLKPILQSIDNNIENFNKYLISQHALEVNVRGIKTGVKSFDANLTIKALEKQFPQFKNIAKETYKYQDEILRYAKDSGVISDTLYKKFKLKSPKYVPFYRVFEDLQQQGHLGKALADIGKPIKALKGSEKKFLPPVEGMIKNTYTILNAAEKNRVLKSFVNFAEKSPHLSRIFEKVPRKMAKVANINLSKELKKLGVDTNLEDKIIDIFRPAFHTKEPIINVMIKGNLKSYKINDKYLYNAIKGLDEDDIWSITKLFQKPASWLRAGATSFSPDFPIRNIARDQLSAFIYSKYGYVPGYDFTKGLFHLAKKDDLYWQWQKSGGAFANIVAIDRDYTIHKASDLLKGKKIKYLNPMELMREFSETGESATRLGEFAKGIKKGVSSTTAALSSRDVTLDFAKMGSKINNANRMIAFLNAGLQGIARPVQAFKEAPVRTAMKIGIGITLPSMINYFLNKDDPVYKEIPQWEKNIFWHIVLKDKIIRIPKPYDLGIVFGTIPERALEYIETQDPQAIKEMGKALTGLKVNVMPTAVLPFIENAANYSFFRQRAIDQGKVLPQEEYSEYTPEIYKKVGGLLKYSPKKLENFGRSWTGGGGKLVTDLIDKTIFKKEKKLPTTLADVPVVRGFISREPIGSRSESVNTFYENFKRVSQIYNTLKEKAVAGKDFEKVKEDYPEYKSYVIFNTTAKLISMIRKKMNQVMNNNELTKEKRAEQIRELNIKITELAKNANEQHKEQAQPQSMQKIYYKYLQER